MAEMTAVASSWIAAIGYEEGQILVETKDGSTYEYPASEAQFKEFLASPSKGHWFSANLK